MDNYYFKLVCVDEQNVFAYDVLEDENFKDLNSVHKYIDDHIKLHTPETSKWMLIPFRKDEVR